MDTSLRAGIMGTSGAPPAPRSWGTHGRVLNAAERGELNNDIGWPCPDGRPFCRWDYIPASTADKHAVLVYLWTSTLGLAWRAHPANLPVLPKGDPQL